MGVWQRYQPVFKTSLLSPHCCRHIQEYDMFAYNTPQISHLQYRFVKFEKYSHFNVYDVDLLQGL